MYQAFVERLSMTLKTVEINWICFCCGNFYFIQKNEQTQQVRLSIEAQKKFVDKLVELTNIVKRVQGSAKVKVNECFSLNSKF